MYDYDDYNPKDTINHIKNLIQQQDAQISDLQFTRNCYVDKLFTTIRTVPTFPWSYTEKFFYAINNYLKGNLDADNNPQKSYDWALDTLKTVFPNAKEITDVVFVGFNTYAINLNFSVEDSDTIYRLYIPIPQNITRTDVEYDGWDNVRHINYDIAQFQLYKQISASGWELICADYNFNNIAIPKEGE